MANAIHFRDDLEFGLNKTMKLAMMPLIKPINMNKKRPILSIEL